MEGRADGAELIIEGTVNRSILSTKTLGIIFLIVYSGGGQDFSFTLRARRPGNTQALWTGTVERQLKGRNGEARLTAILQSMMSEITQNLVKGLESHRDRFSAPASNTAAPSGTSVEDILRSIGKE